MRRMTYAQAAAGAAAPSSGGDLQQQPSTGTSPSLCSAPSFPDEGENRKQQGLVRRNSPQAAAETLATAAAAAPAATSAAAAGTSALVGASPGTVKLLKEQFERQSSDSSLPGAARLRLSAAPPTSAASAAAAPIGDSCSSADDVKHWELLSDAKACAEVIQQLLQEKQQLQQQVDSLWSQREAFRCANERISRVLLRQQQKQQQPVTAAALVAAAEAAGATPRKDFARRSVTVVPSGCLTARGPRGPRGPRMNRALGTPDSGCSLGLSPVLEAGGAQPSLQHPRQHRQQQQKRQSASVPGVSPLDLGAVGAASARPAKGQTMRGGLSGESWGALQGLGPLWGPRSCRPSLASTALKTPRRKFVDGGISARGAGDRAVLRRGTEEQQHLAVEEALVASMRSLNLLGALGPSNSSSNRKKVKAAAAAAAAAGRWEPTSEAELLRCSSVPEKGYWHSTFLCVLKIEGTDFFLDAVLPQQQQQLNAQRIGSSFFGSSSSSASDSRWEQSMNQARIIASKETAGAFEVCVRHLLSGENWLRSVCTSMYWGLPSGVDSAALPPDQTARQGLLDEQTQAGALGLTRLSSTPSDSGREDDEVASSASSSSSSGGGGPWSGWDAVAFLYRHSIDAVGAPVPGKAPGPSESLYIASRAQVAWGSSRSSTNSSISSSKADKTDKTPASTSSSTLSSSSSNTVDSRRAEPFSLSNQLILQEGQAIEQLFIVRASDRRKGLMPLYHHASRKYLHVHATMGLVGLVPPVVEQERQLRQQQKDEQHQTKKAKKRFKAKKQQSDSPSQQQQETCKGDNNTPARGAIASDSSPQAAADMAPLEVLRPCRIELIPLGDMVLQQSVQRVLSSVQEVALQQLQQLQQQQAEEQAYLGTSRQVQPPDAPVAAPSGDCSSCSSSGEEDSFDGVVASEGGEEADPSTGSSRIRRPLVPPLGIGGPTVRAAPMPVAAAAAEAEAAQAVEEGSAPAAASQPPAVVEFRLDDEGVETDVEEVGSVGRAKSSGSSKSSSSNNPSSGGHAYDWLNSGDPTKQ
ncbi:hypothetical protein Efla_002823 [Eimeria flavescens]